MSSQATTIDEGEIPQGRATMIDFDRGQRFRIINHLGQQVVDTWVFARGTGTEFLSMEQIVADTSPGRHDTLCSSCDSGSYEEYGQGRNHPNCRANIVNAFAERGMPLPVVPCPWNLFMDIPVTVDGAMSDRPSSAKAGDYVELRALSDITLVCSPCPQAGIPISGIGRKPRGVRWARMI